MRVAFALTLWASLALGFLPIVPIGGADMPVVISMPNSYSSRVACGVVFALSNSVLVIAGAPVGSSPRPTSAAANSPANSPADAWIINRNLQKKLTLSAMSRVDLRFLPEFSPAAGKIRAAPEGTCRWGGAARILREAK
jgi:hypothetical protein